MHTIILCILLARLLIESGAWPVAFYECNLAMSGILADAEAQNGRTINVYDVTIPCEVEPLCYDFSLVDKFLAQPSVLQALGVSPKADWTDCNMAVHTLFLGDWVGNFAIDLPAVLAQNISVLVYSGTNDFICNYMGGDQWTYNMEWPGQTAFQQAPFKQWTLDEMRAGESKSALGLTVLHVYNAGHMVPMNQPFNALQMLKIFLSGKPI